MPAPTTIIAVSSDDDARVSQAQTLLPEYAETLDVDLSFQNFDQELDQFPSSYMPPAGALLLATREGHLAGSVAMRRLDRETCEMKRLYVRPDFRGLGVGRDLAAAIIDAARDLCLPENAPRHVARHGRRPGSLPNPWIPGDRRLL